MTIENKPARPPGELDGRFIGDVFGSLLFPARGREDGAIAAFRARSVSTRSAVITSEAAAVRGEAVSLRFDGIGIRHGEVERVFKGGFIVSFEAGGEAVELTDKLDWLKAKSRGKAEDRRAHRRVLPRDGAARLILGRDAMEPCVVKDMSRSGAAVLAASVPPIGHLVAVGSVPGHVVRHFEGGFAIRFVALQNLDLLEGLMTLRTGAEKVMAQRQLNDTERALKQN